jgi:hypothetical protein
LGLPPASHRQLWQIVIKLPTDYEPCGEAIDCR